MSNGRRRRVPTARFANVSLPAWSGRSPRSRRRKLPAISAAPHSTISSEVSIRAAAANGCTTNGLPAAMVRSRKMTDRAPWRASTGGIWLRGNLPKCAKPGCRSWVESSRLCVDSGGGGRMRGGLSMQRGLRVLTTGARYSLLADGAVLPAFGVLGGRSGFPVGCWINRDGALADFDTPGKVAGYQVEQDDVVLIRSAGGGGYGDPLERDAQRVGADVREGYVSPKAARELFGVLLDEEGRVDSLATSQCRKRLRVSRIMLTAVLDPAV